jgi:hypothetical protein
MHRDAATRARHYSIRDGLIRKWGSSRSRLQRLSVNGGFRRRVHGMRKVVDTSFLQTDALRAYLSASTDNYAVLTEFAAMEAYKQGTPDSFAKRMEILVQFPTQVIVLKGTLDVCALSGRDAAARKRMIDETQTREFPDFCQHLRAANRGDLFIRQQVLENEREARANLDRMLLGSPTLSRGMEEMQKTYTAAELTILRRREVHTPQLENKLVRNVISLAVELMKPHPNVAYIPRGPQIRNTFPFRLALCAYVSFLKRIEEGGTGKVSHENLRNDMVDANFAAFATYFDGLLTNDKRAADIYARAEYLLRETFAMPPPWSLASLIVRWRSWT